MNFLNEKLALEEKGVEIFTARDFAGFFRLSENTAALKLWRYRKSGYLKSPKKGIYYFADDPPDVLEIANFIYQPSYVSLETVLSKNGVIPEVVYAVTSITTKASRDFSGNGTAYIYSKIKKEAYTGYSLKSNVLIANVNKALVDYLYFVSQGQKTLNDRINLMMVNQEECLKYSRLYDNKRLNNLMKKTWLIKKI